MVKLRHRPHFRLALFLFLLVLLCVGAAAANSWSQHVFDQLVTAVPTVSADWACLPVPETFQQQDLVGTWVADFSGGTGTDTLHLYADGTFEQSYEDASTNYRYKGELGQWSLENRASGGLYLHLQGMKFCAFEDHCMDPGLMNEFGGFRDYCEREFVQMNGEYILAVVGADPRLYLNEPHRGVVLKSFRPSGWEFFFHEYVLQAPK